MGILSAARGTSVWKGYEYYENKKVKDFNKISDAEYQARVLGSKKGGYNVKINIDHIRQSKCDCPFADGKRVICKHMVALYFTAFPQEANDYIAEVESYEREEEEREQEQYKRLEQYVNSLSKKELQEKLLSALIDLEDNDDRYW